MPRPRTWTVRQRIAAATPRQAAEQVRHALAEGVDELELTIDPFSANGFELGAPGAAETAADLAIVLESVDLSRTSIALDGDAITGLAFLLCAADSKGSDRAQLRGELGFDPTQNLEGVDGPARERAGWRRASALLTYCAKHTTGLRPLAIDGRWCHEVGGSAAEELACIAAQTIETAAGARAAGP